MTSPDTPTDLSWVPHNCRLDLHYDPRTGNWSGSLCLRDDYLGYLVGGLDMKTRTPEEAIAETHREFRAVPSPKEVARHSYYLRAGVLPE